MICCWLLVCVLILMSSKEVTNMNEQKSEVTETGNTTTLNAKDELQSDHSMMGFLDVVADDDAKEEEEVEEKEDLEEEEKNNCWTKTKAFREHITEKKFLESSKDCTLIEPTLPIEKKVRRGVYNRRFAETYSTSTTSNWNNEKRMAVAFDTDTFHHYWYEKDNMDQKGGMDYENELEFDLSEPVNLKKYNNHMEILRSLHRHTSAYDVSAFTELPNIIKLGDNEPIAITETLSFPFSQSYDLSSLYVTSCDWSATNSYLLAATHGFPRFKNSDSFFNHIYDINNCSLPLINLEANSKLTSLKFCFDDPNVLAGGSFEGYVGKCELMSTSLTYLQVNEPIVSVDWLGDSSNRLILSAHPNGKINLWDIRNFEEPLETFFSVQHSTFSTRKYGPSVMSVQRAQELTFMVGYVDGTLISYKYKPGSSDDAQQRKWKSFNTCIKSINNHPHIKGVMAVASNSKVRLLTNELVDRPLLTLTAKSRTSLIAAKWMRPNGLLLLGHQDGTIQLRSIIHQNEQPVASIDIRSQVTSMAMSELDNNPLACGTHDGKIIIVRLREDLLSDCELKATNEILNSYTNYYYNQEHVGLLSLTTEKKIDEEKTDDTPVLMSNQFNEDEIGKGEDIDYMKEKRELQEQFDTLDEEDEEYIKLLHIAKIGLRNKRNVLDEYQKKVFARSDKAVKRNTYNEDFLWNINASVQETVKAPIQKYLSNLHVHHNKIVIG